MGKGLEEEKLMTELLLAFHRSKKGCRESLTFAPGIKTICFDSSKVGADLSSALHLLRRDHGWKVWAKELLQEKLLKRKMEEFKSWKD